MIAGLATLYIAALLFLFVGSTRDELQDGQSHWHVIAEIVAGLFLIVFVIGFILPEVASTLDVLIIPMTIYALVWEGMTTWRAASRLQPDTNLTSQENRLATLAGVVVYIMLMFPACALGVILSIQAVSD